MNSVSITRIRVQPREHHKRKKKKSRNLQAGKDNEKENKTNSSQTGNSQLKERLIEKNVKYGGPSGAA